MAEPGEFKPVQGRIGWIVTCIGIVGIWMWLELFPLAEDPPDVRGDFSWLAQSLLQNRVGLRDTGGMYEQTWTPNNLVLTTTGEDPRGGGLRTDSMFALERRRDFVDVADRLGAHERIYATLEGSRVDSTMSIQAAGLPGFETLGNGVRSDGTKSFVYTATLFHRDEYYTVSASSPWGVRNEALAKFRRMLRSLKR
jgi:hypothetical protein